MESIALIDPDEGRADSQLVLSPYFVNNPLSDQPLLLSRLLPNGP